MSLKRRHDIQDNDLIPALGTICFTLTLNVIIHGVFKLSVMELSKINFYETFRIFLNFYIILDILYYLKSSLHMKLNGLGCIPLRFQY